MIKNVDILILLEYERVEIEKKCFWLFENSVKQIDLNWNEVIMKEVLIS